MTLAPELLLLLASVIPGGAEPADGPPVRTNLHDGGADTLAQTAEPTPHPSSGPELDCVACGMG